MQSYFPNGDGHLDAVYRRDGGVLLEPQPIYARKGEKPRSSPPTTRRSGRWSAARSPTGRSTFMKHSREQGHTVLSLPAVHPTHIPTIPDPEYAGKTKHGTWADILTQIDDLSGRILDELTPLGLDDDTIVMWASDNGADSTSPRTGRRPRPVRRPVERILRHLAWLAVHCAGGFEPHPVHHALAEKGARRKGEQRARP
jgi:arylsulfatase A-like enzyme